MSESTELVLLDLGFLRRRAAVFDPSSLPMSRLSQELRGIDASAGVSERLIEISFGLALRAQAEGRFDAAKELFAQVQAAAIGLGLDWWVSEERRRSLIELPIAIARSSAEALSLEWFNEIFKNAHQLCRHYRQSGDEEGRLITILGLCQAFFCFIEHANFFFPTPETLTAAGSFHRWAMSALHVQWETGLDFQSETGDWFTEIEQALDMLQGALQTVQGIVNEALDDGDSSCWNNADLFQRTHRLLDQTAG